MIKTEHSATAAQRAVTSEGEGASGAPETTPPSDTATIAGTATTSMEVDQDRAGSAGVTSNDALAVAVVKTEQQPEAAVAAAAAAHETPNGNNSTGSNDDGAVLGGAKMLKQETAGQERRSGNAPVAAPAGIGISRATSAGGRPVRLPLDPTSVHPAFAGRRPLSKHESPASGRSYGLWDAAAVHPVYFGHLRHDGEAPGAAGMDGWTGAGDGGAIDRALRVLRGAADSEAAAAAAAAVGGDGDGDGDGGNGMGKGAAGVVSWSAEERATVLGLLCEEASITGVALDHMKV